MLSDEGREVSAEWCGKSGEGRARADLGQAVEALKQVQSRRAHPAVDQMFPAIKRLPASQS